MTGWTLERPYPQQWMRDTDNTSRITEDGNYRITEDGSFVRILEKRLVSWSLEQQGQSPWTREEVSPWH